MHDAVELARQQQDLELLGPQALAALREGVQVGCLVAVAGDGDGARARGQGWVPGGEEGGEDGDLGEGEGGGAGADVEGSRRGGACGEGGVGWG